MQRLRPEVADAAAAVFADAAAAGTRSWARDAGRAVLVALACAAGASALRLVTLSDNHGCVRRGTIALQWSSRLLLRSLRIRVVSTGFLRSGPSLVVANGETWLDMVVLAAAGPMRPVVDAHHLRQSVIGVGARRAGAVCAVDDGDRRPHAVVDAITVALRRGHRVLAFPCAGRPAADRSAALRVRPAIIQAAVDAGAVVAPVAIVLRVPTGGSPPCPDGFRGFAGALWHVLRAGPANAHLHWLPVIPAIVADGHRSRHRARTADRAARAINQALAGPAPDRPVLPATSTAATAQYWVEPTLVQPNLVEPRSRMVSIPRFSRSA